MGKENTSLAFNTILKYSILRAATKMSRVLDLKENL